MENKINYIVVSDEVAINWEKEEREAAELHEVCERAVLEKMRDASITKFKGKFLNGTVIESDKFLE